MKTLILLIIFNIAVFAGGRGSPRPWVQTSQGVAVTVLTDKKEYRPGEKVLLFVQQKNVKGAPKIFQRTYLFAQFRVEVFRDGKLLELDRDIISDSYISASGSDKIPVGKAWTEKASLSAVCPLNETGEYLVRVKKTFGDIENEQSEAAYKRMQSSLTAETRFTIKAPKKQ